MLFIILRIGGVENLNYFHSAILKKKFQIFFASFLFKSVTIYGIIRMGQNLYDYHDFQINQGVCRIMNNTVCIIECTDYGLTKAPLLFAAQIQIPVPNKYSDVDIKA